MVFTDAALPKKGSGSGTGLSLAVRVTKGRGVLARLTLTETVQNTLFGGAVAGLHFHAQVGRGSDEGRLRLVQADDGEFVAKASVRGSVTITMAAWDLLPKDRRPAGACKVHSRPSNFEAILDLPTWSKPSGAGGRMEVDFGLKKSPPAGRGGVK